MQMGKRKQDTEDMEGRGAGGVAKIRRKGKSKQQQKQEQQHPQDTPAGRRICFLLLVSYGKCSLLNIPLTPNTHFFLGYHVDPLLKKGSIYLEKPGFQKIA